MAETFTWHADLAAERAVKPKINRINFGEGYEQRFPQGLNFMNDSWSLKFSRSRAEYDQIMDFFKRHGGYISFLWTDPRGKQGLFVCREWNDKQAKFGLFEISCDFDGVPD